MGVGAHEIKSEAGWGSGGNNGQETITKKRLAGLAGLSH